MKCRRFCVVWSLFAAFLVSTGCHSEEEAVPKVDYGKSVVESEVGKATAPRAPYDPNRAFNRLDRDGDQMLDVSEFSQDLKTRQERTRQSHVFRAVDRDQDGRVSLDEFSNRPPEARLSPQGYEFRQYDVVRGIPHSRHGLGYRRACDACLHADGPRWQRQPEPRRIPHQAFRSVVCQD